MTLTMTRARRNRDLQLRLIAVKTVKSGTRDHTSLDGEAVQAGCKIYLKEAVKQPAYGCVVASELLLGTLRNNALVKTGAR